MAAEVDAQHGQAMGLEGREVAVRLRVDERAEGVALAGDGQVRGVAGYELEEPAGPRSAFVELAGRMQVARPVADGGGPFRGIAEGEADPSQRRVTLSRRPHEGGDCEVAPLRDVPQMGGQAVGEGRIADGQP